MTHEEIMKVVNSVGERLEKNDVSALDDLKTLPNEEAVAVAMMYFKQYNYVYNSTDLDHQKSAKAAELTTDIPGSEDYFKRLLRKQPSPVPGQLARMRVVALDLLVKTHTKASVRIMAEALSDPELAARPGDIGKALATMSLPDAPFTKADGNNAGIPTGIAKWKEWWTANKGQYVEDAK